MMIALYILLGIVLGILLVFIAFKLILGGQLRKVWQKTTPMPADFYLPPPPED
jgi:hypothetical protein